MNHPPQITNAPGSYTILAGRTLTLTNSATDPDQPAQALTWNLLAPPTGAAINSGNGIFSWRPAIAQSPATNIISLQVSDNGTPAMSATQSFTVTIQQPQIPALGTAALSNNLFSFQISGDAGPDYVVETSTNLAADSAWLPVITNLSATPPYSWTDPVTMAAGQKFFRVRLEP